MSGLLSSFIMRSLVLVLFFFFHSIYGFAARGAAERATIFSIYLAEEIFTDASGFEIAKDCIGTRTGIRGQPNRCGVVEFCKHVWMMTPRPTGQVDANIKPILVNDAMPDETEYSRNHPKEQALWSSKINDLAMADMFLVQNEILGAKYRDPQGIHRDYTHHLNAGNVLDGITDYYELMAKIGGKYNRAWERIESVKAADGKSPSANRRELNSGQRKFLDKWALQAKRGMSFCYELRLSEHNKFMLKSEGLQKTFGHKIIGLDRTYLAEPAEDNRKRKRSDVVFEDDKFGKGFAQKLESKVPKWKMADKIETVKVYVDKFSSPEAANQQYDKAVQDFEKTKEGSAHKRAIDAIEKSVQVANTC